MLQRNLFRDRVQHTESAMEDQEEVRAWILTHDARPWYTPRDFDTPA